MAQCPACGSPKLTEQPCPKCPLVAEFWGGSLDGAWLELEPRD